MFDFREVGDIASSGFNELPDIDPLWVIAWSYEVWDTIGSTL